MMIGARTYFLGSLIESFPRIASVMGRIETGMMRKRLDEVRIESPVFICGLARSGSTKILEILNSHPDTVSLEYGDFPFFFIPYWWNRYAKPIVTRHCKAVERIHKDRIMVTPESPEAFEEIIWMSCFEELHKQEESAILDDFTENTEFEVSYGEFIRKILLRRQGGRYLAKANYHSTRIRYLRKLFPDARFIFPVRHPLSQVESLIRQHQHFCQLGQRNHRIIKHMTRIGHFEFGPQRRPVNVGSRASANNIAALWHEGCDAEGYAHMWSNIYSYIHDLVKEDEDISRSVTIVR
jgi:hypothetical protein